MPSLSDAISASASALEAQRARMEVAVSNMANAESTRGADGQPYRRRDVVLSPEPIAGADSFASSLRGAQAIGVKVENVVEDQKPFARRYEPSHPDAGPDGYVSLPNVDVPEEMVNMLSAARAYQANITAIGLIRDTVQRALELGK